MTTPELVVLPRAKGKTSAAIRRAARDHLCIVAIDAREVRRVADVARAMGLDIPFPITFEEFLGGRFYSRGIRGFIVDNADYLIRYIARGVPVAMITATQDEG